MSFPSSTSHKLALGTLLFAIAIVPGLDDAAAFLAGVAVAEGRTAISGPLRATLHPAAIEDGASLGYLEGFAGDEGVPFPQLDIDVAASVRGDLAEIRVTQIFDNPHAVPVDARYTFPLPTRAAVHGMTVTVGDERLRAVIDTIEQATETFEAAQESGQSAALLTQQRPNLYTQDIANLMPGMPVEVTLQYVMEVPRVDGAWELALPMTIGRYFVPPGSGTPNPGEAAPLDAFGQPVPSTADGVQAWELAASPPVPHADAAQAPMISIDLDLRAGVAVQQLQSPTHVIRERWLEDDHVQIGLGQADVIADRDFILRYTLADDQLAAGAVSHFDEGQGTFSLLIEPPPADTTAPVVPREVVLVMDTSGSMDGRPIEVSKGLATRLLENLRAQDSFRIVQFGDSASEYADAPLPATPNNIAAGVRHIATMHGSGGTMMVRGVEQALHGDPEPGTLRLVFFLTDGYIGDDAAVLQQLHEQRGRARLFAVGVGDSINRHLLEELGEIGRGFTRIVTLDEDPDEVVERLAARVQTPIATDLEIDWGGLQVEALVPAALPDLFDGDAVRIRGRYVTPGSATVTLRAIEPSGAAVEWPIEVTLADAPDHDVIPVLWARATIAERMREMSLGSHAGSAADLDALQREVTALGLAHSLATRWTAFVAVSERVVNPDRDATAAVWVPVAEPSGTLAPTPAYAGRSTPEPVGMLALLLAAAGAGRASRRRRKCDA